MIETDAEFVERIKREWDGDNVPCVEDFDQLIALARRGAAVQAAECTCPNCDHSSDCAVHNEPALPAGTCDCGVTMQWRPIEEAPKDREVIGIERPPGEDRNFYRMVKWDDEKNAWVTQVDIDWSVSPGRVVYAVCHGVSHFIHPDAVPLIPEEIVEASDDD